MLARSCPAAALILADANLHLLFHAPLCVRQQVLLFFGRDQ